MKRKIFALLAVGAMLLSTGCGNKAVFDTTYTFNKAIVKLADGSTIEGKVQSWSDYVDGDQIRVKIDGKTYLVHSMNITLIAE